MSAPIEWTKSATPAEIGNTLFGGGVIVVRRLTGVEALGARVRLLLCEAFGTDDPPNAEATTAPEQFREISIRARRLVDNDAEAAALWCAVLAEIGYDLDDLYGDRMRLRVVPSREAARGRRTRPLAPHRDSWAANIPAQINWWMPLYPLVESRTMLIWPGLFATPVRNTSAEWDFATLTSGNVRDYPLLPVAEEEPETRPMPVVIEPGDLLAFSAAHLHASAVDDSGVTRFSLDTRSVSGADIRGGRGAPNVDGAGLQQRYEWFARFSDGRSALDEFGAVSRGGPVAA